MGKYKVKLIFTFCPYCSTQVMSNVLIGFQHALSCTKCKKVFYIRYIGERIVTEKAEDQE